MNLGYLWTELMYWNGNVAILTPGETLKHFIVYDYVCTDDWCH